MVRPEYRCDDHNSPAHAPRSRSTQQLQTACYPGYPTHGSPIRAYDVTPDGQRFLSAEMTIVLNWPPAR